MKNFVADFSKRPRTFLICPTVSLLIFRQSPTLLMSKRMLVYVLFKYLPVGARHLTRYLIYFHLPDNAYQFLPVIFYRNSVTNLSN